MSERAKVSAQVLSRRTLLRGLFGATLAFVEIGCAAGSSSSPATPTPALSRLSPTPGTPTTTTSQGPGAPLLTYRGHEGMVDAVVWHDRRIASGGVDATVQVWEVANRHLVFTYPFNDYALAYATRWSPDGRRLASALNDGTAQVWDATTGSHALVYSGHNGAVIDVAWSPDGRYVASSGADRTVQVWDEAKGTLVFTYRGHTDEVTQLAWSPDGARLASGSNDGTVQICRGL